MRENRWLSNIAVFFLLLLPLCFCSTGPENVITGDTAAAWKQAIRSDHPRIFFNKDTWPAVKARALGEEAALYDSLKARSEELISSGQPAPGDYGAQASEAAFVYLVEGDSRYLDLAHTLLDTSIAYYHQCYREKKSVSWYSFSRINAWAALDWIFNGLPRAERQRLAGSFLAALKNTMPTGDYSGPREAFPLENWSGPQSGFYGERSLAWYAGLAAWKEGIDDKQAEEFLTDGYEQNLELLRYRSAAAGDDGGSASAALNYALAAYPWAEFNFFHSYRSATGKDIALEWPYVARLSGYIFWNWLPGGHCFGAGDDYHIDNRIRTSTLNLHLAQVEHFYADNLPEYAAVSRYLAGIIPREKRATFPWARFLLTGQATEISRPAAPPENLPLARYFENMGQVFLRSGSGPEDTYAMFTIGGTLENHKHFDHNHFAIYHKGFLALDTGSRPEPGIHLYNYYCRTIAHNCVLIYLPGEEMPSYWGKKVGVPAPGEEALPVPNDGGQREILGSKAVAFETNGDFAYLAGDATPTYHPDKCRLAIRQFVFIPPSYFVVFDRVAAAKPEYGKTWLLHTATEPVLSGHQFYADQDQGRLFCRTLWPEDAALKKIGGPGKQFVNGGRNWPLPEAFQARDTTQLLGQWRVEVTPGAASAEDCFLHLIQVGDSGLKKMAVSKLLKGPDELGVSFKDGGTSCEVRFRTTGEAAGRIKIEQQGKVVVDRDFTSTVQPQQGLAGNM